MTRQELSRLHWLGRDIEREQRQLDGLRERGAGDEAELDELARRLETHLRQSRREYVRLTEYIQSVADPQMRLILHLRYVNGLSWRQIAQRLGGGNTEDGVRMMRSRFLQKEGTEKRE